MIIHSQHPDSHYIVQPLIYDKSIESRAYQKNIVESAYGKSTLVVLPTALGKTIIAIMLTAHTLYIYRRKRVMVVAPTRPLVLQHMKSFFSVLKISRGKIAEITGKTPPLPRTAIWNNKDIRLVFATPEVVRNDLQDKRLSLNDFSLLIIDEAHRAVKDYAYTTIANRYMSQSEHPVILAMTASPGSDTKRIHDVCKNLFIEHIEYRTEEDIDVKPYINFINVNWQWVSLSSEYNYIRSILKNMLDDKLRWLFQHRLLRKRGGIQWIFKRDLIDTGAEIRYNLELSQEETRASLYFALMQQSLALTLLYCVELIESQGSASLKAFLDRIEKDSSTFSSSITRGGGSTKTQKSLINDPKVKEIRTLLSTLKIEHPKVKCLVEILRGKMTEQLMQQQSLVRTDNNSNNDNNNKGDYKVKSFSYDSSNIDTTIPTKNSDIMRAIVFTQYRDTARHIVDILNSNNITAARFVGQAKKDGDVGMKQEEQAQMLEVFRRGEFSVLVATSIAEEGLDIPEVDLVIFYEPIPSEIRYIQRRGRTGRRSSGSVIILAAKDTIDERYLNASKRRIEKMNQALSTIKSVLKSMNRITSSSTPILDVMTSEEISAMEVDKAKSEIKTEKFMESQATSTFTKDVPKWLTLLERDYTIQFARDVNNAARRIHSLLVKKGRSGEDVDIIRGTLGFDNNILVEALKKLEKLKRIKWLDDVTIMLSDNLKHIPGEVHDIYIENTLSGIALVMIDGKWHARLNHYDYEGPRHLLKKGTEFKAVSDLYNDGKIFCVRIRQ
ncbi:MAG: helicase-related protein, partial [Nitrososphaeraceae archaeon]